MFSNKEMFKQALVEKLKTNFGKKVETASEYDTYRALGALVKDEITKKWMETEERYQKDQTKQVYYFSMEFLMGRLLGNNLLNMNLLKLVQDGLEDLGLSLDSLEENENDAGLGNGGLGRLAACFLDSLASLNLAGHGYGMRYRYGMFDQHIIDGKQVELPDEWLSKDFIWEVRRPEEAIEVKYEGYVDFKEDSSGNWKFEYVDYEKIRAVPYDVPIVGYNNETVNTLRLWSAEATTEDIMVRAKRKNEMGYFLNHRRALESVSEFLYPDDSTEEGRRLRLKQEYFLVSAGVQSIIQSFEKTGLPWSAFSDKTAIHINDTHPALVIPELMRILVDEKGLGWDQAWEITQSVVSYTNHTTLSEALESWPVNTVRTLLPRLFMIIEEINERFCQALWKTYPGDFDRIANLAIVADGQVKMAHLSIVGSHSINGVAKLHTEILKKREMKSFYETFPSKFNNKTNGITHRRWLMHANKPLSNLITEAIGDQWMNEPDRLKDLLKKKEDLSFLDRLDDVKQNNKIALADWVKETQGITVDPQSIFDVHIKRLHGYKRQLLNALHIMHLYNELKADPTLDMVPRTFFFGAKAASGYYFAKKVIQLINRIAAVINKDDEVNDKIKVVFLPNYSVSTAEKIIPASNVSEQISTASKEASGTGNMKFMMNGALTIGTMDGANVEIHDLVGDENIYTFGLSSEEVLEYYRTGGYSSKQVSDQDERLRHTLEQLIHYSPFSKGEMDFQPIYEALIHHNDEYFVLKDFADYVMAQRKVSQDYQNKRLWNAKSLVNIAQSGHFSSDRTIQEYASQIWNIERVQMLK
ncbi:glycogen/starch/alpha-glucan phosphorylase [Halobacillus yeomjeoni]|uniref:glycogen/starch/alpha-glucan phosphorylase n=1 Tax=Halobacillus yeomjeoni TaxID=311194 RepID=UPI001CD73DF5|nr:glycogen/starch/alpha-glucan phosphorylase [Halobacillus yeomjeoni]MCA0984816.1 glycogen/starch/alpha-glucan phosphorylase [Halobacillus yeomjeoni]